MQPSTARPSLPAWLVAGLWLLVVAVLGWLTQACLYGFVTYPLSPEQMVDSGRVVHVLLPAFGDPAAKDFPLELLEDGQPRELDARTYWIVAKDLGPTRSPVTLVYFAGSDRSDPRVNGRQYAIRIPRRQRPATFALLLAAWIGLPLLVWRIARVPLERLRVGVEGAALMLAGALYSLFVIQAWLPPSNLRWFLLVAAAGLPALGGRLRDGPRSLFPQSPWVPWLGGFLLWAAASQFGPGPDASESTLVGMIATFAWGLVLYLAFRSARSPEEGVQTVPFVAVFLVAASLSLLRDAGFDLAGSLAALGWSATWKGGLVNPWTTKFTAHWIVVTLWCALAAVAWRCRRRVDLALLMLLGAVTIAANGSKSALLALAASIPVFLLGGWRPRVVRCTVICALLAGLLLAPLLAGIPWWLQSNLPERWTDGTLAVLEMDVRGGTWEFARHRIGQHPLTGWGLGAGPNLPGAETPMVEALDLDPTTAGPVLTRRPILVGGHPHNVTLLVWLELGLVGAVLLAGLLWTFGKAIAWVEGDRWTHASLLGLLTATVAFLLFNYPAWESEVLSILWMTSILAAALLPRQPVRRPELLRDAALVLIVLALGGVLLLWQR